MSAWIVSKEHIDLIVHAIANGTRDGSLKGRTIDKRKVGQMLVDECVASVSYRYPRDTTEQLPGPRPCYYTQPYRFTDPKYAPTAAELYQSIRCYDYQSCEHVERWEASEAKAMLDDVLRNIEFNHTPAARHRHEIDRQHKAHTEQGHSGPTLYRWAALDAAPWGIDADSLGKLRDARRAELRQPLPAELAAAPDYAAADWLRDHGHDSQADELLSMADMPKPKQFKKPRQPRQPRRPSPMFAAVPALAARCGALVELGRRFRPGRDDE